MRGISDLIESDMENSNNFIDENDILSSPPDATTAKLIKKPKKRHRVTMPKAKAKVAKSSPEPTKRPTSKSVAVKRKALEEVVNEQGTSAQNKVKEEASEETTSKPKPRGRQSAKAKVQKDLSEPASMGEDMEVEQTPLVARSHYAAADARKNAPKVVVNSPAVQKSKQAKVAATTVVPESQADFMDMDTELHNTTEVLVEAVPMPKQRVGPRSRPEASYRRRAGSASDTERGDPNLRRKLGDMSRKYENIDAKYRSLKEVGLKEANANMERLRKQCDAITQASNDLVASLRKELAAQAPLAQEARKLKKEMQSREKEIIGLKDGTAELSASLVTANNEIKALQARLAAARSSSVAVESAMSKTPGSAIKTTRTIMMGSVEAAQAAQVAQMKEDLYSDLTGLIVRSVKRTEEGDTYDCIQTGRNGSKFARLGSQPNTDLWQLSISSSMSTRRMQKRQALKKPSFFTLRCLMPIATGT